MTVKLALVQTLTAGLPQPLRFGMTAAELMALLGATDDVMVRSRRDRRPAIVRYGSIEFHFDPDQGLALVYADYFAVPRGALGLDVDPGWIAGSLQLGEAEQRLHELGVAYQIAVDPVSVRRTPEV